MAGINWTPSTKHRKCRTCYTRRMERHNGISRLAYRIAGGSSAFYQLNRPERLLLREKAADLYDAGQDFATATVAEQVRRDGFVYVIAHPSFGRAVKVGRAFDPESRLSSFQTAAPDRGFRLHFAEYFEDCLAAERWLHSRLTAHQLEGEWFAIEPHEAQEAIEAYARLHPNQLEVN